MADRPGPTYKELMERARKYQVRLSPSSAPASAPASRPSVPTTAAPKEKLNTYLLYPIVGPQSDGAGWWEDQKFRVVGTRPPTVGAVSEYGQAEPASWIDWDTDSSNWLVGEWSTGSDHHRPPGSLTARTSISVIAIEAPDAEAAKEVARNMSPTDLTHTLKNVSLRADSQGRLLPWNISGRSNFDVDVQQASWRLFGQVEPGHNYYYIAENRTGRHEDGRSYVVEGTSRGQVYQQFWSENARPGQHYELAVYGPLQIVKTIKWKGAKANRSRRGRSRRRC